VGGYTVRRAVPCLRNWVLINSKLSYDSSAASSPHTAIYCFLQFTVSNHFLHYATSQTVPGSIPGGVTGDFFSVVPPTEPCALRSTQPHKMSTKDFSWGKGGRCVWLTTYHPCSVETSKNPWP